MMPTRVQSGSHSSIECVVSITVQFLSCVEMRWMTSHMKRRASGSAAPAGLVY
jgi:hypothetical protein